MKGVVAVLFILATVWLAAAGPAWARGGHGGHCGAGGGHGHALGTGGGAGEPLASGPQSLGDCSGRLQDGVFCPTNGPGFGDESYQETSEEGSHESDLGPWWIFLFLGRSVVRGIRWLVGA
jgi:hypothetical protein